MQTDDLNDNDYAVLTLQDLLKARDQNHHFLMKKKNVIATAVGYYRIRDQEHWPTKENPHPDNSEFKSVVRRLENSEVRPYSWPAILVFVKEWKPAGDFMGEPEAFIPKSLTFGNGREVPVCVIEATRQPHAGPGIDPATLNFPRNVISGGFPLMTTVQQDIKVASLGCLVTDGHLTYALTNRHVAGASGSAISTMLDGEPTVIGTSSDLQLGRLPFSDVYPGLGGDQTYLNMDIGLVEVANVHQWKTEILGIGQMDEMIDVYAENVSLKLIGKKVTGFGAATAERFKGEVQALFYRYKSLGGFDYVCDFLVGPRKDSDPASVAIHPGDSGTLIMMENQKKAGDQWVDCFQPLGILWGSHEFTDGKQKHVQPYILSTFLSTVCNLLDVELVRDWNLDTVNTWGSIGHFKIGALACDLVINTSNCFKFLQKNKLNIGYSDDTMQSGDMVNGRYHAGTFVPLADVPDIVWRSLRKVKDGSNHFADMDENFPSVAGGKTLLQLNEDPAFLDIQKWLDFDKKMDIAHPLTKSSKNGPVPAPRRGALPFRVWQSYNWMVKYLKQGDLYQFLVAGGTMSHYLGDACQPLHISYLHHGASAAEIDVHSDYETDMIADHMQELFTLVAGKIKEVKANELISEKGKDAALKVIGLMRDTVTDFPPMTVLESWRKGGSSPKARRDQMWKDLHDQTAATIANGAHVLAILWQSAWKAGNGDAIPAGQLITLDPQKLMELYVAPATVPAYRLDDTAEYTAACY